LEDEGTSVAPPRRSILPAISSTTVSPAEAVPTISSEAIPAISTEAIPAISVEAIPTISAEAVPATAAVLEPTPTSVPAPTDDLVLEDIHPQGSSRATGGFMRHRAAASYYSPADEENTMFNDIGAAKLTAKIYTSDLDPLNINLDNMVPSSKVTIKMNPNLGPILENISQRYPAIKGIC